MARVITLLAQFPEISIDRGYKTGEQKKIPDDGKENGYRGKLFRGWLSCFLSSSLQEKLTSVSPPTMPFSGGGLFSLLLTRKHDFEGVVFVHTRPTFSMRYIVLKRTRRQQK